MGAQGTENWAREILPAGTEEPKPKPWLKIPTMGATGECRGKAQHVSVLYTQDHALQRAYLPWHGGAVLWLPVLVCITRVISKSIFFPVQSHLRLCSRF